MIQKKSDDAVSPVIGVMLMLVVTIVIAGVIATFGTGMIGTTESAPNVVLDVKIMSNFEALSQGDGDLTGPDFQILHVSGDALDTGDIEIQIAWKDLNGDYHDSKYSADAFKASGVSLPGSREQPMYVKALINGAMAESYFGDAILTPGLRLTASTDFLHMNLIPDPETSEVPENKHKGSQFMNAIFASGKTFSNFDSLEDAGVMEYLQPGTPVDITILHIPSNTIIYEKEVVVQ